MSILNRTYVIFERIPPTILSVIIRRLSAQTLASIERSICWISVLKDSLLLLHPQRLFPLGDPLGVVQTVELESLDHEYGPLECAEDVRVLPLQLHQLRCL